MHKFLTIFFLLCAWYTGITGNVITVPKKISDYLTSKQYVKEAIVYYWSNEMKPYTANKLFKETSLEGSYFAVGNADRSYINAALSNAHSIILADYDPGIVAFNIINTILLRVADTPDFYRMYRRKIELAGFVLENEFALEDPRLTKGAFLKACSLFWNYVNSKFEQKFEPLSSPVGKSRNCPGAHSPTISSLEYDSGFITLLCPGGTEHPFEHVNFLYDQDMFTRVKELASSAMIIELDITSGKQLKQFQKNLLSNDLKLSVIDISNIFPIDYVCTGETVDVFSSVRHDKNIRFYIKPEQFESFLKIMHPLCHDESMLVSTEWNKNLERTTVITTDGHVLDLPHTDWDYKFAPFKDIYLKQCSALKTAFPNGLEGQKPQD